MRHFMSNRKWPHYKLKRCKSVHKIFIRLHEYAKCLHLSHPSNPHKNVCNGEYSKKSPVKLGIFYEPKANSHSKNTTDKPK